MLTAWTCLERLGPCAWKPLMDFSQSCIGLTTLSAPGGFFWQHTAMSPAASFWLYQAEESSFYLVSRVPKCLALKDHLYNTLSQYLQQLL